MSNVAEFFSRAVGKKKDFYNPPLSIEDMELVCFAIGTDGIDSDGAPKEYDSTRVRLFSEDNFWNDGAQYNDSDMKRYVYQVTFEQTDNENVAEDLNTTNEGATFPVDASGNPMRYRENIIGVDATKLTVNSTFSNNIIEFNFHLGQFAGNGCERWSLAPKFSEAALYMRRSATSLGDHLGTIFSMRTFPELPKTDACSIKIKWVIDFNVTGESC